MLGPPSLLFLYRPKWFLDEELDDLNLREWSKDFSWERDPLWGKWDVAKSPQKTLSDKSGDCDDYARLVATVLYNRDEEFEICSLFGNGGHMVIATEYAVFSSGNIFNKSFEEYFNETEYSWAICHKIES